MNEVYSTTPPHEKVGGDTLRRCLQNYDFVGPGEGFDDFLWGEKLCWPWLTFIVRRFIVPFLGTKHLCLCDVNGSPFMSVVALLLLSIFLWPVWWVFAPI
jgi:hypothetical protein